MGFVISAPEISGSGGVRALHKLAVEIRERGHRVCMDWWGGVECGSPFGLESVNSWDAVAVSEAVHVYPQGICLVRDERVARWLLDTSHGPYTPEGDIFTWVSELMPGKPRLTVDIVEPEFFYPKKRPGRGTLVWMGKGGANMARVPDGAVHITSCWPESRKELGKELRAADLLISFDSFSAINLEATVCGTPVLLAGNFPERSATALFGSAGRSASEDEARATVGKAIADYERVRKEIAGDVDRFIEICECH